MPNHTVPAAATGLPSDMPRRAVLTGIPAAAIGIGSMTALAGMDAALLSLGRQLDEIDAQKLALPAADERGFLELHDRHWELRQRINLAIPESLEGIRVKARAAEYAYREDADAENSGPGSFIELSRSICRDLRDI